LKPRLRWLTTGRQETLAGQAATAGPDYNFSHQQFTEAKPELEKSGWMGFLRKSAAMMSKGEDGDALVVFPEATGNLIVRSIRRSQSRSDNQAARWNNIPSAEVLS
jgi:hypothetical protein